MEDDEDEEDEEEGEDEESKQSDSSSEIESYSSLNDVDSEELEPSSEEDNPHGFVYARTLDTFRRSKREKIE